MLVGASPFCAQVLGWLRFDGPKRSRDLAQAPGKRKVVTCKTVKATMNNNSSNHLLSSPGLGKPKHASSIFGTKRFRVLLFFV